MTSAARCVAPALVPATSSVPSAGRRSNIHLTESEIVRPRGRTRRIVQSSDTENRVMLSEAKYLGSTPCLFPAAGILHRRDQSDTLVALDLPNVQERWRRTRGRDLENKEGPLTATMQDVDLTAAQAAAVRAIDEAAD